MATLNNILQEIGAYIDQDTSLPTGDDLLTRAKFIDIALQEWGNAYQWKELRVVNSNISFALSGTSTALPSNYKKLMSPVKDTVATTDNTWIEINPEDRYDKVNGDKWVAIGGDQSSGKFMMLSGMPSGASLNFDYQSFPSSMVTLQDVCVCPHHEYITKRATALILESRSDSRFPQVKADADVLLSRMIEEDETPSLAENNRIDDWPRSIDFVIGED